MIDLGANHGEFTRVMSSNYGANCIAVEPNRLLHPDILLTGATHVLLAAIGSENGQAAFNVSSKDDASTLLPVIGVENNAAVVPTVRLESLIDELSLTRIDLLKIDIEGMEVEAILTLRPDQLAIVQQLSVEFHDAQGYVTQKDVSRAILHMRDAAFRHVKMSFKDHSDVLFVRADRCSWLRWARVTLIDVKLHQLKRVFERINLTCA